MLPPVSYRKSTFSEIERQIKKPDVGRTSSSDPCIRVIQTNSAAVFMPFRIDIVDEKREIPAHALTPAATGTPVLEILENLRSPCWRKLGGALLF